MNSKLTLPIAILIAGLAVASALAIAKIEKNTGNEDLEAKLLSSIKSINSKDHYLGNPKARVILIEYSDYDCSFCAGFFQNMKRIMDELGKDGDIVWVHRHMPLFQIHQSAKLKAQAAECSASLGNEDTFWKVSEELYDAALTGKKIDLNELPVKFGMDTVKFKACLDQKDFLPLIESQYSEAYEAGARGTPFTVIIMGDKRYAVAESLPYFELRSLIESLLEGR